LIILKFLLRLVYLGHKRLNLGKILNKRMNMSIRYHLDIRLIDRKDNWLTYRTRHLHRTHKILSCLETLRLRNLTQLTNMVIS
jgi:hypothetical protein